jgi:serine/threonine protein kinase
LFYKVKGKIGYMSPEQAKSEPLDHRSDLYSLAVCMYEILSGERLFVHAGLTTSADEIYSQPIPQISRKVPGLSPDFDAIMSKALSIDPNKRYQTAGELQEALMRCAHRNGLLMSAPELATELRAACGPLDQWRDDDDDDDFGYAQKRAGTEVYDASDDDDEDEGSGELQIAPSGPLSIHNIAARTPKSPTKPPPIPPARAKTEIGKFQGKELTSIINMFDLEQAGSKPLVDLNAAPAPLTLDSGPRSLGSGPQALSPNPAPLPKPGKYLPSDRQTLGEAPTQLAPRQPMQRQPLPPPMQMPMQPMQPTQQQPRAFTPPPLEGADRLPAARRRSTMAPDGMTMPGRSGLNPWIVIVAILLVAGIVAIIVAMSGPDVPGK